MNKRPVISFVAAAGALAALCTWPALGQTPRIRALFPAGAKAGETVEVAVRGGGLDGAKRVLLVGGDGVSAELVPSDTVVDESAKPLFQQKCGLCHDLRGPANRTLTADQWAATVDRMINARSAPIAKNERDKIVGYLQSAARAGQVVARVRVAVTAAPGLRELRLLTNHGASTAYPFEVGTLPETTAEPGTGLEQPQKVTLPVVINGTLAQSGERHCFTFDAKKGERLTFNLKGFRLNEQSQEFFHPALFLHDADGKVVAKSHGYFDLDPLIDWTAPQNAPYTLVVRDLLWGGSPASVYRLALGALSYETFLQPGAGRPGALVSATVHGHPGTSQPVRLPIPAEADGITLLSTPLGETRFLVRDLPDGGGPIGTTEGASPLPALFHGTITRPDQIDVFRVDVTEGKTGLELYARRLGSPLRARITVRTDKGKVVKVATSEGANDPSLPAVFADPGRYVIEVTSEDGKSGSGFAYYLEVLGGAADFALEATPDTLSIGPGGTAALVVRAVRRHRVRGAIVVSVRNLPAGVTASSGVIPPDDDKTTITVSADPSAVVDGRVVFVEGQLVDKTQTLSRRARPIEVYSTGNQQTRMLPRASQVIAVASEPPPFTLVPDTNTLALSPGEEAKLSVKIVRRNGFKNNVVLSLPALPPGVSLAREVNVPAGQNEATLTIRVSNDARFLRERPVSDLPPMQIAVTGTTADATCSSPLVLLVPGKITAKNP